MIGIDTQTGAPRFTFGEVHLYDGIDFLVAIVGLAPVGMFTLNIGTANDTATDKIRVGRIIPPCCPSHPDHGPHLDPWYRRRSAGRGGFAWLVHLILDEAADQGAPSARAIRAAWPHPKPATTPLPVARGADAGAWGARLAPRRCCWRARRDHAGAAAVHAEPDVVWGLIAALFIGNFMLLAPNIPMVGLFTRVLMVRRVLMPIVAMVSFVGIYGILGSSFDLTVMILFGVGVGLRKLDVPLVPIIWARCGQRNGGQPRRAVNIADGAIPCWPCPY